MSGISTWLKEGWKEFTYRNGELCCEEVPLAEISETVGTPFYVYSSRSIRQAYQSYEEGFGQRRHLIDPN